MFWEDLSPEEKEALKAARRSELEAIGKMQFPVEGSFNGEPVTILGPVHRFPPYDDPAYGKPGPSANAQLMLQRSDGERFIGMAPSVTVGGKPLMGRNPRMRDPRDPWEKKMFKENPTAATRASWADRFEALSRTPNPGDVQEAGMVLHDFLLETGTDEIEVDHFDNLIEYLVEAIGEGRDAVRVFRQLIAELRGQPYEDLRLDVRAVAIPKEFSPRAREAALNFLKKQGLTYSGGGFSFRTPEDAYDRWADFYVSPPDEAPTAVAYVSHEGGEPPYAFDYDHEDYKTIEALAKELKKHGFYTDSLTSWLSVIVDHRAEPKTRGGKKKRRMRENPNDDESYIIDVGGDASDAPTLEKAIETARFYVTDPKGTWGHGRFEPAPFAVVYKSGDAPPSPLFAVWRDEKGKVRESTDPAVMTHWFRKARGQHQMYPEIPESRTGQYALKRDGKFVMRGTMDEIWKHIHQTHGYSVSHALQHEGYSIEPLHLYRVKENPTMQVIPGGGHPGPIDAFTSAYIEAALWSSVDDNDQPLDKNYGLYNIAPQTLSCMIADCERFQRENAEALLERGDEQGGHDFWLTRNGHGAGFWDGDWPEHGDELTKAAKAFGEVDLYVGDDKRIYQAGCERGTLRRVKENPAENEIERWEAGEAARRVPRRRTPEDAEALFWKIKSQGGRVFAKQQPDGKWRIWIRFEQGESMGESLSRDQALFDAWRKWRGGSQIEETRENPIEVEDGIPWVKVERDPEQHEQLFELAKQNGPISGARDVYTLLEPWASKQDQESFVVVMLDIHSDLRGVARIHTGSRDRVAVDRSDVLRPVIEQGAKGFIVCHNHPSGHAQPSPADRDLTKALKEGAEEVDVTFLDHVVLGTNEYYSFAEKKLTKVRKKGEPS